MSWLFDRQPSGSVLGQKLEPTREARRKATETVSVGELVLSADVASRLATEAQKECTTLKALIERRLHSAGVQRAQLHQLDISSLGKRTQDVAPTIAKKLAAAAKAAGLDTSKLKAVSPWDPSIGDTPTARTLRAAVEAFEPQLAADLKRDAGVAVPSLALAAAMAEPGFVGSKLTGQIAQEWAAANPDEATAHRAAAEQALLLKWEQEAAAKRAAAVQAGQAPSGAAVAAARQSDQRLRWADQQQAWRQGS